ncbi:monocarboxylate transporter 13-like isoform X2 [Glandiceps talaboti]
MKSSSSTNRRPPGCGGQWGWIVVVSAVIVRLIVMGMATTGGVFIVALLEDFNANAATIAWIPALRISIVSFVSPVAGLLNDKYGTRVIVFIGGIISTCGLLLSSFAMNPVYLYFTDGVLTGSRLGRHFNTRDYATLYIQWNDE